MTQGVSPGASHGIRSRPADTLLSDRARDFLAAAPADAATLVRHVCQLPGARGDAAERIADTLLGGRPEFWRDGYGRWCLTGVVYAASATATLVTTVTTATATVATASTATATIASATTAGAATVLPAAPMQLRLPTFDEWRAARGAHAPDQRGSARVSEAHATLASPSPRPSASPRPAPHDDALRSLSFVVVDVETTGGNPRTGHRITEFAAVVVRDGRVHEEIYETLVNPQRSIPPMITALTNISWSMVHDQPPFHDICQRVVQALEGHVFVAHNATFDWKFVSTEVERASGLRLEGRRLCTVRLARKLLPQLPRRSLDWVARHYGVDITARHRAGGDALATAHVLLGLLRDAEQRGVATWADLERLLGSRTAKARRRRSSLAMPRPVDRDTTA